jgi:ribosomal protein S18 acetylase RimI-like enzyme
MIRKVQQKDAESLVQLGIDSGLFGPGEAEQLLGDTLNKLLAGQLPTGHQAHLLEQENQIVGWMYFGPMEKPDEWNLWWIGVARQVKGSGFGTMLLKFFEDAARSGGAKTAIIETSSGPLLAGTRAFYQARGYRESHSEADAYGPGEDKLVFIKEIREWLRVLVLGVAVEWSWCEMAMN